MLGQSRAEIAAALSIEVNTVRDIRQRADYRMLHAELKSEAMERTRARIRSLNDKAVLVLEQAMDGAVEDKDRIKAAIEVLNRGGIRGGAEVTVKRAPSTMTAEEMRTELAAIVSELDSAEGGSNDDAED